MVDSMTNEIVVIGEARWLVKAAHTRHDAMCAIASAGCAGAPGYRLVRDAMGPSGPVIVAEVARLSAGGAVLQ
jgi:hypothetical protein